MSDTLLTLGEPLDLFERIKENLNYDEGITSKIMAATEEYDIAVTQCIARSILARLPLELRTHVYRFLSPDQITVCASRYATCSATPHIHGYRKHYGKIWHLNGGSSVYLSTRPYPTCFARTERDSDCSQHFWSDEAMGANMAHELLETFYRTTTFTIEADSLMEALPSDFLAAVPSDGFGANLPSADWVSNIRLDLTVHAWTMLDATDQTRQDRIVSSWIEALDSLRTNMHIDIMLHLHQDAREVYLGGFDGGILDRLMECILPALVKLRKGKRFFAIGYADEGMEEEMKTVFERWLDRLGKEVLVEGNLVSRV